MIYTASSSRVRAIVPSDQRWLEMLDAVMRRMGIPVRDCILGDDRLVVTVHGQGGLPFSLVLEPSKRGQPAFREIGPFALSYHGKQQLDQPDMKVLLLFEKIVRRLGDRIPRKLKGFAALVHDIKDDPELVLRKLFPFVTVERSAGPLGDSVEVLVRTTSRCNQACPFCSAPTHSQPAEDIVLACARQAAELLPGATFSLTGGEPTLKDSFQAEVREALAQPGLREVQVQTNALAFGTRIDPRNLEPADRLSFFVSLHATDPATYDACTGTTGMLQHARAGIDELLQAGHRVTLNTVACSLNVDHLETMAGAIPAGTGGRPVEWHLSALICPHDNPAAEGVLVRYSRLVPAVLRATEVATERGIRTSSLLSSTHAAVPPCVLPQTHEVDRRWLLDENREVELPPDRMKAEGCRGCPENKRCPGVPAAYGRRYGLDELKPLVRGSGE